MPTKKYEIAPGIFVSSARVSQLRYPERVAARRLVTAAIKSGRLIRQPCRVCGSVLSEAHHSDYTRPLKVQWLCVVHHAEADAALGRVRRRDRNFRYHVDPAIHRAGAALGKKGGTSRAKKYKQRLA